MKTVIGMNGSPRKHKNSAIVLEHALQGAADAGAETKLHHLVDHSFSGCRSCFACKLLEGKSFGKCALRDGLAPLLEEIFEADGLVLSMPIYFGDVPGMVRNLMERLWFPGLLYRKDGAIAYEKRIKVTLLYTMNVPDANLYRETIEEHARLFTQFFGKTTVYCVTNTLQYNDYSLYTGDVFDPQHKLEHHRAVFPEDCKKAYQLGRAMV